MGREVRGWGWWGRWWWVVWLDYLSNEIQILKNGGWVGGGGRVGWWWVGVVECVVVGWGGVGRVWVVGCGWSG